MCEQVGETYCLTTPQSNVSYKIFLMCGSYFVYELLNINNVYLVTINFHLHP